MKTITSTLDHIAGGKTHCNHQKLFVLEKDDHLKVGSIKISYLGGYDYKINGVTAKYVPKGDNNWNLPSATTGSLVPRDKITVECDEQYLYVHANYVECC
jgi:hypothetical protein